jgi:phosphohistidine phosphatase
MKYLTLLRHAKSDWDQTGLSDHQRPLNDRGQRAAPVVGRFIAKTYLGANGIPAVLPKVDRIISSTAVRALSTARLVADAMALDQSRIIQEGTAYLAEPKTLLQIVQGLDESWNHVIMVGHNPGITDFANRLLKKGELEEMPTCAAAIIELPSSLWGLVDWREARLVGFVTPKLIEKRFAGEVAAIA